MGLQKTQKVESLSAYMNSHHHKNVHIYKRIFVDDAPVSGTRRELYPYLHEDTKYP
jgi:hypothetical protein